MGDLFVVSQSGGDYSSARAFLMAAAWSGVGVEGQRPGSIPTVLMDKPTPTSTVLVVPPEASFGSVSQDGTTRLVSLPVVVEQVVEEQVELVMLPTLSGAGQFLEVVTVVAGGPSSRGGGSFVVRDSP
jgi:hypothetical protein